VDEDLREPVGGDAIDKHVLVMLEDADGHLAAVVGVGVVGVCFPRSIDEREDIAAAKGRGRRVAAVGRGRVQRDAPRGNEVLAVAAGPGDLRLLGFDFRLRAGDVAVCKVRHFSNSLG
jgi:hypothetical protein